MARTDIHRPSVINPADYNLIGFRYVGRNADMTMAFANSRSVVAEHMAKTGGKYSNHEHGGTCYVCGAYAMTLAVYHHPKTNTYICTGEDCADKMDLATDGIDLFRKNMKSLANVYAGKRKAEKTLADLGLSRAWEIFNLDPKDKEFEEGTITSIVINTIRYGSISDKQVAFVKSLIEKIDNRAALKAEREKQNAISNYVGKVGQRIDIVGTIYFVRTFDSAYGVTTITGIRDNVGNVFIQKGVRIGDKNDQVSLKATIKDHKVYEGLKQTIITRPKVM